MKIDVTQWYWNADKLSPVNRRSWSNKRKKWLCWFLKNHFYCYKLKNSPFYIFTRPLMRLDGAIFSPDGVFSYALFFLFIDTSAEFSFLVKSFSLQIVRTKIELELQWRFWRNSRISMLD
jgi:hypothetical protein